MPRSIESESSVRAQSSAFLRIRTVHRPILARLPNRAHRPRPKIRRVLTDSRHRWLDRTRFASFTVATVKTSVKHGITKCIGEGRVLRCDKADIRVREDLPNSPSASGWSGEPQTLLNPQAQFAIDFAEYHRTVLMMTGEDRRL